MLCCAKGNLRGGGGAFSKHQATTEQPWSKYNLLLNKISYPHKIDFFIIVLMRDN